VVRLQSVLLEELDQHELVRFQLGLGHEIRGSQQVDNAQHIEFLKQFAVSLLKQQVIWIFPLSAAVLDSRHEELHILEAEDLALFQVLVQCSLNVGVFRFVSCLGSCVEFLDHRIVQVKPLEVLQQEVRERAQKRKETAEHSENSKKVD
jgi:hypothetical protein